MAQRFWPAKDPDAVRDFGIDWTGDLGDAAITSSTWTVVAGSVVIDGHGHDEGRTWLRLSGGVAGERCKLHNRIELSTGEVDEVTRPLTIRNK